jgi:hypothetical protein
LFALPLTFLLPFWFGEPGIWYAGIVAELNHRHAGADASTALVGASRPAERRTRAGRHWRWGLLRGRSVTSPDSLFQTLYGRQIGGRKLLFSENLFHRAANLIRVPV